MGPLALVILDASIFIVLINLFIAPVDTTMIYV